VSKRERPFVVYRRRHSGYSITPRGISGWFQVAVWLAIPVPVLMVFFDLAAFYGGGESLAGAVVLAIVLLALWVVAGYWWVHAHADIVDPGEPGKRPQILAKRKRNKP
jgi:hypothetical protein